MDRRSGGRGGRGRREGEISNWRWRIFAEIRAGWGMGMDVAED